MDTSKEYAVMCKAAEDLQELSIDDSVLMGKRMFYFRDEDRIYWIPTQDQLQDLYKDPIMLEEELGGKRRTPHLIYDFYTFVFGGQFARAKDKTPVMEYSLKFKSMEQMWLGFIMQERYEKRWNGEKWTVK